MYLKKLSIFSTLTLLFHIGCKHTTTVHEPTESEDVEIEGSWSLVSSKFADVTITHPSWDGYMFIDEGHYSRSYVLRDPKQNIDFAPAFSNAGRYTIDGSKIQLNATFNTFKERQGIQWNNEFTLSAEGTLLTFSDGEQGTFVEIWKRKDLQGSK